MKKILLVGILILLFFVGTAAAVSVDYAQKQAIPLSTARENANSALISYVAQGKLGSSAALWKGAALSQTPITIYDQSGVVYSYLFDVINKDGIIVGQVDAAGNKLVGMPIIDIEKSPRPFDPEMVIPEVRDRVLQLYAHARINSVVFIMDQDGEIGVMAILTEQNGLNHRITYDLQTLKIGTDRISNNGLVDAATPTSIFVSMSSSSATRAIQNYDTKAKSVARVVPVMRRVIQVSYLNTTTIKNTGVSTVKSVEKEVIPLGYKPSSSLHGLTSTYTITHVTSSTTGQPFLASRFFPG